MGVKAPSGFITYEGHVQFLFVDTLFRYSVSQIRGKEQQPGSDVCVPNTSSKSYY